MTQPLLSRIGRALYGPTWNAPMAGDLGVSARTVQRWSAETAPIPQGVWRDLATLLARRSTVLNAIRSRARGVPSTELAAKREVIRVLILEASKRAFAAPAASAETEEASA